jgi:hypothetical protein
MTGVQEGGEASYYVRVLRTEIYGVRVSNSVFPPFTFGGERRRAYLVLVIHKIYDGSTGSRP